MPTPGAETRATRAAGQIAATASAEGGPELPGLLPTAAALAGPPATELPAPPAAPSVAPADLPAPVREPRFFVGLVGAPDVTTVKLAGVYAPMLNVGVTVEYRLGQRWRLSTGLLHSSKKYVALRDDYDWGTNYARVYQRSFEDVDGSCTVLDIPLNLRYDLLVYPQSRLFGSLGLSSFLMQREHYSYDYLENNVRKQWNGEFANQNQHLFSILNLSAGYERRLGGHWRVQAEPYLKLPLAGVGQGKVRLTSAGVFLGVKYGF